jgi:hypothetical protein
MGKWETRTSTTHKIGPFIAMLSEISTVTAAVDTVLVLAAKRAKAPSEVPPSVSMAVQRVVALGEHFPICKLLLPETYLHHLIALNLDIDPLTALTPFRQARQYMALVFHQVLVRSCVVGWEVLLEK